MKTNFEKFQNLLFIVNLSIFCLMLIFIIFVIGIYSTNKSLNNKLIVIEQKIEQIEKLSLDTTNVVEKIITLTVYNPVENQCDEDPLTTANGTKIDLDKLKNGEIKYCAVSRDLLEEFPYGSKIYIEGHGEYEVVDTMNKRFKNYVDILQDVSEKGFKKENIKISKVK